MLETGGYTVEEDKFYWNTPKVTQYSERKKEEIMNWLHNRIKEHEAGKDIYETRKDFCDRNCSGVIM